MDTMEQVLYTASSPAECIKTGHKVKSDESKRFRNVCKTAIIISLNTINMQVRKDWVHV